MGKRFEIARAADKAGVRYRTFSRDLTERGTRSLGNFRRQKMQVELHSSSSHTDGTEQKPKVVNGVEQKSKVRAKDDAKLMQDESTSPWDVEGEVMGIAQPIEEDAFDPTIDLVPGVSVNNLGARQPLDWEYDQSQSVGPTDISGINPGERHTLFDSSEMTGFHTVKPFK